MVGASRFGGEVPLDGAPKWPGANKDVETIQALHLQTG